MVASLKGDENKVKELFGELCRDYLISESKIHNCVLEAMIYAKRGDNYNLMRYLRSIIYDEDSE